MDSSSCDELRLPLALTPTLALVCACPARVGEEGNDLDLEPRCEPVLPTLALVSVELRALCTEGPVDSWDTSLAVLWMELLRDDDVALTAAVLLREAGTGCDLDNSNFNARFTLRWRCLLEAGKDFVVALAFRESSSAVGGFCGLMSGEETSSIGLSSVGSRPAPARGCTAPGALSPEPRVIRNTPPVAGMLAVALMSDSGADDEDEGFRGVPNTDRTDGFGARRFGTLGSGKSGRVRPLCTQKG